MGTKMQNARNMEEKIAEILDGEQSDGPSSRAGVPDLTTDELIVECKHRKKLPQWFKDAVNQAEEYHGGESEKSPVTVFHEKNQEHVMDFAVLRLLDLKYLLNGGEDD